MLQGYYKLTSGMLNQSRNLNVVSDNMTNITTPGYKKEKMLTTTFQDEVFYRNGNRGKAEPQAIGSISMIPTADETVTNHEQGNFEETGRIYDVALATPGFFSVQSENGTVYTRNGSFSVDAEGYLCLEPVGRVLGTNGAPILIAGEDFTIDASGNIIENRSAYGPGAGDGEELDYEYEETEAPTIYGTIGVVDFADYNQLTRAGNGVYTAGGEPAAAQPVIYWKTIEQSNVNPIEEMTAMMSSQRALQSSAQVLKMYDQLMGKIVTEIGKI